MALTPEDTPGCEPSASWAGTEDGAACGAPDEPAIGSAEEPPQALLEPCNVEGEGEPDGSVGVPVEDTARGNSKAGGSHSAGTAKIAVVSASSLSSVSWLAVAHVRDPEA